MYKIYVCIVDGFGMKMRDTFRLRKSCKCQHSRTSKEIDKNSHNESLSMN